LIRALHRAGNGRQQLRKIAPVYRRILNSGSFNRVADGRSFRIDAGLVCCYDNRCANAADVHFNVNAQTVADRQPRVADGRFLKTARRRRNFVNAGRKRRNFIKPSSFV
jgi:hypothetical protein